MVAVAAVSMLLAPVGGQAGSRTDRGVGQAHTTLSMKSQKGDPIGRGKRWHYDSREKSVDEMWVGGSREEIELYVRAHLTSWAIHIAPPDGELLHQGAYPRAKRWMYNDDRPGLSAFGKGRGCEHVNGRFEIRKLRLFGDGRIRAIDFRFVQHCDGVRPALRGRGVMRRGG